MSEFKLHLGSAKRRLKGFINVDREYSEGIDLVADIRNLRAFSEATVTEIYTSHTLEYFDRDEVKIVLAEWWRKLIPGGKIFISVPNFDSLVKIYNQTGQISDILGPLFGKWHNDFNGETIFHRTVWDYDSLKKCLEFSGFENISIFDPIKYLTAIDDKFDDYSLAFFPHMDRTGIQVSLCLMGVKPF